MSDTIYRQAMLAEVDEWIEALTENCHSESVVDVKMIRKHLALLPSAQSDRLTDDDFETIRIHLNAYKEKLCNQQMLEEADEYQRIIDRFMAFASAQPKRNKGQWIVTSEFEDCRYAKCNQCKVTQVFYYNEPLTNFCPNCGAEMRERNEQKSDDGI